MTTPIRRPPPLMTLCLTAVMLFATYSASADTPPLGPGTSVVGNYLAGRHAQSERDLSVAADYLKAVLDRSPDAPDLQRRTFVLLVMEGRIAEALPIARALNEARPDGTVTNLILVADEFKKKDFAAASKRLQGLPDTGLSGLAGPILLAWSLTAEKKFDEAINTLASRTTEKATKALYELHKAMIQNFSGRTDEAIATLVQLTKDEGAPSFRQMQLLGNIYERAGSTAAAQHLYDEYQKTNPGTNLLYVARQRLASGTKPEPLISSATDGAAEVFFGVANSLRVQRARETALLLGQLAIYLKDEYPIMQILIGEILEMDERYEDANGYYQLIDPASTFGQMAQMRIANNLHDMDRTEEAIAIATKLAAEHPNDPSPIRAVGDYLRATERYKEAIPVYDEAIRRVTELKPVHWRLFYTRGIVLEREKLYLRSEEDFLKALELQPDQPFVLNYLGYSWVEQRRHLDRALEMIQKAVRLRPNDGYIIDSLGWVYYQLGQYDDAVAELERAIEYRPEDPVINDHLGDAYWQVGRKKEARFQWQHSLSLKPEPDVEKLVREKLKNGLQPLSKSIEQIELLAPKKDG